MGLIDAFRGEIDDGLDWMKRALDQTYATSIDSLIDAMNSRPQLRRGAREDADAFTARALANASNRDVRDGAEASSRLRVLACQSGNGVGGWRTPLSGAG